MRTLFVIFTLFGSLSLFPASYSPDDSFQLLIKDFIREYPSLKVPELSLSYVDNFQKIQDLSGISKQNQFFRRYLKALQSINRNELTEEFRHQYDTLVYQLHLDLERVKLERNYRKHASGSVPSGGIYQVRNGRQWYEYYIKKWAAEISPDRLIRFGEKEIKRIRSEMSVIQKQLGYEGKDKEFHQHLNSPSFLVTDESKLLDLFHDFRTLVLGNLFKEFEETSIPLVEIQAAPNPTKDSPPGYYADGVFYYNFYGNRFPKRSLEWLFIHEAVPGHHYQHSVAPASFPTQDLFWYPGFTEGWAAYVEDIGEGLGGYQDPYQHFGKWEWDLVRSARVVIDVGINHQGWSKAEALQYWHNNVPNQDGIAEREIDRMFRWPAQVLAYKVGERTFLSLRKKFQESNQSPEATRRFHTLVLKRGSIPLSVLNTIVEEQISGQTE